MLIQFFFSLAIKDMNTDALKQGGSTTSYGSMEKFSTNIQRFFFFVISKIFIMSKLIF